MENTDHLIWDGYRFTTPAQYRADMERDRAYNERQRQQFAAQRRPAPPPESDVIEWEAP